MYLLRSLVSAFVLVLPSIASGAVELQEQIVALTTQNEYLVKTVQHLEKRLIKLEQSESKHEARTRRQYDGPWTFSYRRDPARVTLNNNDPIVFPTRITDLGGGYDNHTGIYTAPVAGLYMITCSILADHSLSSSPLLHTSIMVDGVPEANIFAFAESGNHRDQGANTIFVNLKQGSRVWVKVIDQPHVTVGGNLYSTFSGYMLWQN